MNAAETRLAEQLATLKLVAVAEQYVELASEAAQKQWPHVDYLARLIDSEAQRRHQLAIQRRVAAARFPCLSSKTKPTSFSWAESASGNGSRKVYRVAVQKCSA